MICITVGALAIPGFAWMGQDDYGLPECTSDDQGECSKIYRKAIQKLDKVMAKWDAEADAHDELIDDYDDVVDALDLYCAPSQGTELPDFCTGNTILHTLSPLIKEEVATIIACREMFAASPGLLSATRCTRYGFGR